MQRECYSLQAVDDRKKVTNYLMFFQVWKFQKLFKFRIEKKYIDKLAMRCRDQLYID